MASLRHFAAGEAYVELAERLNAEAEADPDRDAALLTLLMEGWQEEKAREATYERFRRQLGFSTVETLRSALNNRPGPCSGCPRLRRCATERLC